MSNVAPRGLAEPVVVLLDAEDVSEPSQQPSRRSSGPVIAGVIGAVAGACITAAGFLIGTHTPIHLELSPDTFPEQLFGMIRADVPNGYGSEEVQQQYGDYFGQQIDDHRFAYGGEGAAFDYLHPNGLAGATLTIVNGDLSPGLPSGLSNPAQNAPPVRKSLAFDGVKCTAEVYAGASFGDGEVHDFEVPTCVLTDEVNQISLRIQILLQANDFQEISSYSAEQIASELLDIHSSLIG